MQYNVYVSQLAASQYDRILSYVAVILKNSQAANGIMCDFDHIIDSLENTPEIYAYCKSEILRSKELRVAHFRNHRYIAVYRIKTSNIVVIEGIYHELQDYENSL